MNPKSLSKFLSLLLRHKPEILNLELDPQGWTNLDTLILRLQEDGKQVDRDLILDVVANNNKQRFAISEDGQHIRANQGHSLELDLGYEAQTPPAQLFHGTASRFLDSILTTGLEKRNRHHVHLTDNLETAKQVGGRHGKPVILIINSQEMHQKGMEFFLSENGVWLTKKVPVEFLSLKDG